MSLPTSSDHQLVNIGTVEQPVLLSQKDLDGKWWGKVATGSVVVPDDILDRLLQMTESLPTMNISQING